MKNVGKVSMQKKDEDRGICMFRMNAQGTMTKKRRREKRERTGE
jgi:hypothetical protein